MSEETVSHPYVHLLEGRDPADILREAPTRLNQALAALSTSAIEHKPAPNKWSVREILCHIADCEIAWAWRFRQAYGEDNPTLQAFDQDRWAGPYGSTGFTAAQALATWTALRQWNLALIDSLTEQQKQRPVTHAERGAMTLWTLVQIAAGHDLPALEKLAAA